MILIDSLYINDSGGFRLLKYLVDELIKKNVSFYLLADARCRGKFDYCKHIQYMHASLIKRKKFYQQLCHNITVVFCFGNIPSPIKLKCPVYTYFHNINLLTLSEAHSVRVKIISWLKREVFRYLKRNTDFWLVQTSNTATELINNLGENKERVKLMPFYELPDVVTDIAGHTHGEDYVFVSVYVSGKGHEFLLEAWRELHKKKIDKVLHLTVQKDSPFVDKILEAQNEGVKVINHGVIPFSEVLELYRQSKAIIYPSHNESLGLGIVEAITTGCDVLGSDLPFLHSICRPSLVFNPYSAKSIAEAVIEYERGNIKKSELTIYNHIDELVKLLSN